MVKQYIFKHKTSALIKNKQKKEFVIFLRTIIFIKINRNSDVLCIHSTMNSLSPYGGIDNRSQYFSTEKTKNQSKMICVYLLVVSIK